MERGNCVMYIIKNIMVFFKYSFEGKNKFKENRIEIFYDLDKDISEIYVYIWSDLYKKEINGISEKIFTSKINFTNNKLWIPEDLDNLWKALNASDVIDNDKKQFFELFKIIIKYLELNEATIYLKNIEINEKLKLKEQNKINKILIYLDLYEFKIYFNSYIAIISVYNNEMKERLNKKDKINLEYISKVFL
jgi:hypothetical protein